MFSKKNWIWEVYFLIITYLTILKAIEFLTPSSVYQTYFFILYSFKKTFFVLYALHFFQILINLTQCVCLGLFVYKKRFLSPELWQTLFIMRIFFDLFGQRYAMNQCISLFHFDLLLGLFSIVSLLGLYLPSYIGCFLYSFRQDKALQPK